MISIYSTLELKKVGSIKSFWNSDGGIRKVRLGKTGWKDGSVSDQPFYFYDYNF